jgi:hypothetical protein
MQNEIRRLKVVGAQGKHLFSVPPLLHMIKIPQGKTSCKGTISIQIQLLIKTKSMHGYGF